ncbi:uncharacterized, partial [Tachysurus ichikawai]
TISSQHFSTPFLYTISPLCISMPFLPTVSPQRISTAYLPTVSPQRISTPFLQAISPHHISKLNLLKNTQLYNSTKILKGSSRGITEEPFMARDFLRV